MPTSHETAFAIWEELTSKQHRETQSHILSTLKTAYPDHHVTRTDAARCDVLGFATAGFATATPVDEPGYDASRVYKAPPSRLDGGKGKLEEVIVFAKWKYEYSGSEFIVYELNYQGDWGDVHRIPYVLAPRMTTDGVDGLHHARTDELLYAAGVWTRELHEEIWVYDDSEWEKSHTLWNSVQGTTWDDVVLRFSMQSKLHRDVHGFFDNRELYQKAKIPWKRGIIFHGAPGNGKSMTLAVTINELAKRERPIPALYVRSLDACSGPKWSLQQIFSKARRAAPCLLVLEDLDSLVTDNTRSYFLNQVDGLESNEGILILGSTNHLDRLDTAVTKRPSRFDRKYHFKLPEETERLAYCRYWRKKFADSDVVEFTDEICEVIAKWTVGYSFAYLKELFVTSLLLHSQGAKDDYDEETDGTNGNADIREGTQQANCADPASSHQKVDHAYDNQNKGDAMASKDVEAEAQATKSADSVTKKTPRVLPDVPLPESL